MVKCLMQNLDNDLSTIDFLCVLKSKQLTQEDKQKQTERKKQKTLKNTILCEMMSPHYSDSGQGIRCPYLSSQENRKLHRLQGQTFLLKMTQAKHIPGCPDWQGINKRGTEGQSGKGDVSLKKKSLFVLSNDQKE